MTRLVPAWLALWRCRSCGARHSSVYDTCQYTNIPRELR